jgi:trimeric autotransporter adhesin
MRAALLVVVIWWTASGQTYTISTVAGNGVQGFGGDGGPATSAQLSSPLGVAVDSTGSLYIVDSVNNRIRKVSGGVITTVAGNGTPGFSGDGGPATSAELRYPSDVAVDSTGNLYITDTNNFRIRKVSKGVITTVAGNGSPGFSGDGGPATSAELAASLGIAVDSVGNLYIADSNNSRVRKVANGTITTVAGNGLPLPGSLGSSGDGGPATSAEVTPFDVAVDSAGNLYISDANNNRIRKVSNGVITTIAGNGTSGFSGDGGPATSAELNNPRGLALDSVGNLYIADISNNRMRKVSNGVITTIAGNGTSGFSGDGGPATSAEMTPYFVAGDLAGNLYFSDLSDHVALLTPIAEPSVKPGGVVPVYSTATTIQPGEWVSIYGTNLASSTVTWNGDFPTSLGGTSVTINGKAAYLSFVSPGQIDLQAPDDTAIGTVPVVVTTANNESATSTVTLGQFAPSFALLDTKHVAGIILRPNGSGAYGGGTYDILGPTGTSLGYPTVAAQAGDSVELFGVGFGPTTHAVPAGQAFSGVAPTTNTVQLAINGASVILTFEGLSSAGLYQFNVTIPAGLGTGDLPLVASVGGVQTQSAVVISLQ